MNKYYMSKNQITVVINNKSFTMTSGSSMFPRLTEELNSAEIDWETVGNLIDIKSLLVNYTPNNFEIRNNSFFYKKDGVEITASPIVNRIIDSASNKEDPSKYLHFFDKVLENESESSREELFSFLGCCNLPIIEDGDFLAYKVVTDEYKDCHTQTFDNSIGKIVTMPRGEVNEDRHQSCSTGLHFCSKDYIKHFISDGNRLIVVKINPKNVVCIPEDYNNTKGRCCEYQVIGEVSTSDIPDLKDVDYTSMIKKLEKVEESKSSIQEIRYFEGNQKDFFKRWSEPRNPYTTYILKHSKGETAYKFIGGLGQKCFKPVEMPKVVEDVPNFSTQKEALSKIAKEEGTKVKIKDVPYILKKIKCSDGYFRLRLVKE